MVLDILKLLHWSMSVKNPFNLTRFPPTTGQRKPSPLTSPQLVGTHYRIISNDLSLFSVCFGKNNRQKGNNVL